MLTQDWHPLGHFSFASSHAGKKPFDTIAASYGPQVLWPDHCVQGTPGAAFHPALDIPHAALVLRKGMERTINSYSAFYENDRKTPTGLVGYLRERGLTRVFLAGLAFDFCVRYSAEDAQREGFTVFVVEDACRGIDVDGSVAATRASLATLGVACISALAPPLETCQKPGSYTIPPLPACTYGNAAGGVCNAQKSLTPRAKRQNITKM